MSITITMHRGDTYYGTFSIASADGTLLDLFDNVYITVKKSNTNTNVIFQKSLSAGTVSRGANNTFSFVILPEDTDTLSYGSYVFDVEVLIQDPVYKQTFLGDLILQPEVTFHVNEV